MVRPVFRFWRGGYLLLGCLVTASSVQAQIVPDDTLPANSWVTPGCLVCTIDGGTQRGVNLFHSFSEFSVPTGGEAFFNNALLIQNIFSRVTGNSVSNIDGLLRANGTASLFFLNPNGVIFGQNARLEIGGSFFATTGNSFKFSDGSEFSATNPQAPPLLTVNITPGVQYGTNQPGATIANAGNLAVGTGQTLTLLGGTVTTTGLLIAPGGLVQILGDRIGLLNNTQIDVSSPGGGGTVLIGGDYQGKGSLPNASSTFVGRNTTINADALVSGNGGRVIIWSDDNTRFYGTISARGGVTGGNGGFVEVSGKQFLDFTGQVDTFAPQGQMGTLLLDPTNIEVVATGAETFNLTDVDQFTDPNIGADGDTKISANVLSLATSNVVLQATNNITFNAGIYNVFGVDITADAGNDIIVNNFIATLGGNVNLNAGRDVFLTKINALIWTYGGDARLSAGGNVSLTNNAQVDIAPYTGDSGNLDVTARSVTLTNGAQLRAGTLSDGNGGTLTVNASESIELSGIGLFGSTGFNTTTEAGSTGAAGNIVITTPRLIVRDGGAIGAPTLGAGNGGSITVNAPELVEVSGSAPGGFDSGIFTSTNGTGDAGALRIDTKRLIIRDGGAVAAGTLGNGNGGNLTVNATESVEVIGISPNGLSSPSRLSTAAVGTGIEGNAGDLTITTGRLIVRDGAIVRASTSGQGNAGNIVLQADDFISLSNGSSIRAVVEAGAVGDGGDIDIKVRSLSVTNGARLGASTSGQGNAGTVKINARETISFDGVGSNGLSSGAFSTVESTAVGKGGDIEIITGSLALTNGAVLSASTLGQGNAGSVYVQANDSVSLVNNSIIFSTVESGAVGNGGNIDIKAASLSLTNGSNLQTLVREAFGILPAGQGNAGNVSIDVRDAVTLAGARNGVVSGVGSLVNPGGIGNGGNITLKARSLSISDGANLNASTFGNGNAGKVNIDVPDTIAITGFNIITFNGVNYLSNSSITSGVGLRGIGNGGDIKIKAGSLLLADTAGIFTDTFGQGNAGNIFIQADDAISLTNLSQIRTVVEPGGVGKGGDIDIQARTLSLTNGSQVNAALFRTVGSLPGGQGRGGDIRINAFDFVNIVGVSSFQLPVPVIDPSNPLVNLLTEGFSSGLFTSTERGASGQGGDITVNTHALRVADGAVVNAQTLNPSDGGNITINTDSFEAASGGQVLTLTHSSGRAGNITLNATDRVTLSGSGPNFTNRFTRFGRDVVNNEGAASGLFASATDGAGQAGDLHIATEQLTVRDGAQVTVSSPQGQAGNLNITANSLTLNQGTLSAVTGTSSTEGGANITLNGLDFLRMDNESLISASALNNANGGNVTIDSTFIVATPPTGSQGSDIIANAEQGNGGRVNVTTQGLFGIQFRPQRTPKNDITVSSTFGLSGTFALNTPGVDPSRGLAQLPTNVVDASQQIDQRCTPKAANQGGSFTITGRGGIPPSPNDTLQAESLITPNWVILDSDRENNTPPAPTIPTNSAPKQLVEAQGWRMNEQGQVVLTANAPNVTPHDAWQTPVQCPGDVNPVSE